MEKLERREGIDLELKGRRALAGRTALQRRGAQPPGQHGHARRRQPSIYTQQLRESQRLKIAYGVRERQFRRLVELARKRRDITSGEALLQLLELRLDNVVFRLGLASTRRQARQFVGHGHVLVNGRRCDIASRRLKPGDTVALREDSPVELAARDAAELIGRVVAWLEADLDGLRGRVLRDPVRADVTLEVTEQLVIERYSRR